MTTRLQKALEKNDASELLSIQCENAWGTLLFDVFDKPGKKSKKDFFVCLDYGYKPSQDPCLDKFLTSPNLDIFLRYLREKNTDVPETFAFLMQNNYAWYTDYLGPLIGPDVARAKENNMSFLEVIWQNYQEDSSFRSEDKIITTDLIKITKKFIQKGFPVERDGARVLAVMKKTIDELSYNQSVHVNKLRDFVNDFEVLFVASQKKEMLDKINTKKSFNKNPRKM